LRENPAKVLAEGEITIPPLPLYGMSVLLGFILLLVLSTPICLVEAGILWVVDQIFLHPLGFAVKNLPPEAAVILLILHGSITLSVIVWLVRRLLRAPRMQLNAAGVTLERGRQRVVFPWAAFDTPGRNPGVGEKRLFLPVAPAALLTVQAFLDDFVVEQGDRI
jgi:hypothetical protein